MSRVSEAFSNKKTLIAYITAGDPSLKETERLVYGLAEAGVGIIELGIPFSDPLADGPVIQASHQRALKNKVALAEVFRLVIRLRKKTNIPICFMLAYNLILRYGEEKFYRDAERTGVDGIISPDLPPEKINNRTKVASILLIAPTTTEERIKAITARASGFIYLVSVAGVTGQRKKLAANLKGLVTRIRKYTALPIAIGFGISTPQQAAEAVKIADGVIVGSAIVDLIGRKKTQEVPRFIKSFVRAIAAS